MSDLDMKPPAPADDDLSDASLIEEEDEEEEDEDEDSLPGHEERRPPAAEDEGRRGSVDLDDDSSADNFVIDLPGEPVTEPVELSDENKRVEEEEGDDDGLPDFRGWRPIEIDLYGTIKRKRQFVEAVTEDDEIFWLAPSSGLSLLPPEMAHRVKGRSRKVSPARQETFPEQKPPTKEQTPIRTKAVKRRHSATTQPPTRRESREWRPSSMLFKPLIAGWVREVIYKEKTDGTLNTDIQPQVKYHPPRIPGTKPRVFRHISELQSYINTAEPSLSCHNFSFRKEPMGAPAGQEIIRGETQKVEIFPHKEEAVPQGVAKKNQKSRANCEGSNGTGESQDVSDMAPSSAASLSPSIGKLKVKTFSKMNEKNSLTNSGGDDSSGISDHDADGGGSPAGGAKRRAVEGGSGFAGAHMTRHGSGASGSAAISPSVRITPVTTVRTNAAGAGAAAAAAGWPPPRVPRPVLRPALPGPVSCSIHCPRVGGFPSLSCLSCHSIFHPTCVGLPEGTDYEATYDFYCAGCQPPPGKENANPFSHMPPAAPGSSTPSSLMGVRKNEDLFSNRRSSGRAATGRNKFSPASSLPKGLSITPKNPSLYGGMVNGAPSRGTATPPTSRSSGARTSVVTTDPHGPPAPVETQAMVNIGGVKYLVVPLPDKKTAGGTSAKASKQQVESDSRLRVLLRPAASGDTMPSFEVEETTNGKLLLVPTDGRTFGGNPFRKPKESSTLKDQPQQSLVATTSPWSFHDNLNCGYYALLHVFRYLTLTERLQAARVCRLWRDMATHSSIWNSVSLKNIHVLNWAGLVSFLNNVRCTRLDLRKLGNIAATTASANANSAAVSDPWNEVAAAFVDLRTVRRLELPRISSSALASVSASLPRAVIDSIVCNSISQRELDLSGLAAATGLSKVQEIRLKGSSKLKVVGGLGSLMTLAPTLTKLSLLNLDSLSSSDVDALTSLSALSDLSLGDCSEAPQNLFQAVTALTALRTLRLEKARVGINLGELRWLGLLHRLELVDAQLKEGFGDGLVRLASLKQLLVIPAYKDEVASINAEIVDSTLSMGWLTHFYLGLTNEWLQSMSSLMPSAAKDSFPIMVNGACEMYSLTKLFKTLSTAMPTCRVKVLKMPRQATGKQFLESLIR